MDSHRLEHTDRKLQERLSRTVFNCLRRNTGRIGKYWTKVEINVCIQIFYRTHNGNICYFLSFLSWSIRQLNAYTGLKTLFSKFYCISSSPSPCIFRISSYLRKHFLTWAYSTHIIFLCSCVAYVINS
jgi:hypothetical protein